MNLIGLDAAGLARFFEEQGEKPFRARQLLHWIHQQGETDFARMSDLAKALRDKLASSARIEAPVIVGDTAADARNGQRFTAKRFGEPHRVRQPVALLVGQLQAAPRLDADRGPLRVQPVRQPLANGGLATASIPNKNDTHPARLSAGGQHRQQPV